MRTTGFLLLALLAASAAAQQSASACVANCAQNIQGSGSICASDANIYASCSALCAANADNYVFFSCGSTGNCAASCASQVALDNCLSACKPYADKSTLYCGSNGIAFGSLCKFQCSYPNAQAIFVCNANYLYNLSLCQPKCQRTVNCQLTCRNAPSSGYICASDALLYRSSCEVTCNSLTASTLVTATNTQADLDQCLQTVNLQFGAPAGSIAPIPPQKGSA